MCVGFLYTLNLSDPSVVLVVRVSEYHQRIANYELLFHQSKLLVLIAPKMFSVYTLNRQSDNTQPCRTPLLM